MSQPSVTAFFNSRKRQASEEIRNKSKILLLEQTARNTGKKTEHEIPFTTIVSKESSIELSSPRIVYAPSSETKHPSHVRNIQFNSTKSSATGKMTPKAGTRARAARGKKFYTEDGQTDIRETFLKISAEGAGGGTARAVPFEKMGALSPRKKCHETKDEGSKHHQEEATAVGSTTPKKSLLAGCFDRQDLSLGEIKKRICRSSRLSELQASMARIKKHEEKLETLKEQSEEKKPQIRKFVSIELEVPVSPAKVARSPGMSLLSPTKIIELPKSASPQRRLLFEPKESAPSPVKSNPTKMPAYQRYQALAKSGTPALPLPQHYRFLAEVFKCIDGAAAMLYNRKEVITFKKLKPAVQEHLRRNFNLEHLAQIKTIYPEGFLYKQEKVRSFGSTSNKDEYELVLVPVIEPKTGRNTSDPNNVLKSASEMSMGPGVVLDRQRIFYGALLDKAKTEHEKFLLSLESPMNIPKEKINRWHPEFDIESCRAIERGDLPEAPNVEKAHSAKEVLEKAKSLFNCNTRMEKALQRLADTKMTSKNQIDTSTMTTMTTDVGIEEATDIPKKIEISVVDTPPATPTTQSNYMSSLLKGIPKSLLERVRAKQAAKALEAMTRTPMAAREAALYSRLPEMAKILRNIFVAEKKGILPLDVVIMKLDNSYRTKLMATELEEHVRLVCKLFPKYACLEKVRQIDYLKVDKSVDIVKVVKRLEIIANYKVNA